jgi:hypothetical protein
LTANDVVLRHLWLEVIEDGTQSRFQTVKQVYPKSGRTERVSVLKGIRIDVNVAVIIAVIGP